MFSLFLWRPTVTPVTSSSFESAAAIVDHPNIVFIIQPCSPVVVLCHQRCWMWLNTECSQQYLFSLLPLLTICVCWVVFFFNAQFFVPKSEFPYHSRLLLLASKSSSMCFASVLQPGRWQVLKANMKEGELLEGSKEFLLPDPRVSAGFLRNSAITMCIVELPCVLWAKQAPA